MSADLHSSSHGWDEAGPGVGIYAPLGDAGARRAWSKPDMSVLLEGRRAPPALPLDLFGPWKGWIEDTAEGTGPTPPDYAACALLAVAGSLIGNARWVSPWPSWEEPPALWVALVGSPASGKSPALAPLRTILRTLESELAAGFEAAHRGWMADKETAAVLRAAWEQDVKAAVKAGARAPDMPQAAVDPEEPRRPRLMVSDATTEALAGVLVGQPKGILAFRDELSGWLGGFDRYSGSGSDRQFWLEANGGGQFPIDRVKSNGKPLVVPHLTISVLGGIQPDKLVSALFAGDDDGLAARFLLTWPEPIEPRRPKRVADNAGAERALRRLLGLDFARWPDGRPKPVVVPFDDAAAAFLETWRVGNHHATKEAGGKLAGHLGKLSGMLIRLAMVLEHLWWAWGDEPVPPAVVTHTAVVAAAALVSEYFVPMADRAYGDAALSEADRNAATLARWLRKERTEEFTVYNLYRFVRLPGLNRADAAKAACERLEEADVLIDVSSREGGGPGRKRTTYRVNPLFFAGVQ